MHMRTPNTLSRRFAPGLVVLSLVLSGQSGAEEAGQLESAFRGTKWILDSRLRSEDDSVVLGQVPFEEREMLCEADPDTFHFTDHYRNYPMVLARLKRLDAKMLCGYLMRQWRHNAPKKWLKAWDEGTELPALSVKAPRPRKKMR